MSVTQLQQQMSSSQHHLLAVTNELRRAVRDRDDRIRELEMFISRLRGRLASARQGAQWVLDATVIEEKGGTT